MDILTDIKYLKNGTQIQRDAFQSLSKTNTFNILEKYRPILAGTIPLGIDIKGSDLDIICEVHCLDEFESFLIEKFGSYKGFKTYIVNMRGINSLVCQFFCHDFEYEIFGQNKESSQQYAVIHMIVEKRILDILGNEAIESIRKLKQDGLKTESAFCKYLGIKGDPYDELAELYNLNDCDLKKFLNQARLLR